MLPYYKITYGHVKSYNVIDGELQKLEDIQVALLKYIIRKSRSNDIRVVIENMNPLEMCVSDDNTGFKNTVRLKKLGSLVHEAIKAIEKKYSTKLNVEHHLKEYPPPLL